MRKKSDTGFRLLTLRSILSSEIARFCERTTLRSLPRIGKATSKTAQVFWLLVFSLLLFALTLTLRSLIDNFLMYTTHFVIRDDLDEPGIFPSITFCLHRPLSPEGELSVGNFTPVWYFNQYTLWSEAYIQKKLDVGLSRNLIYVPISFPTMTYYYQFFRKREDAVRIGRSLNATVFKCMASEGAGIGMDLSYFWQNCSVMQVNFKVVSIPEYFNCFMATVPAEKEQTVNGIFLFINLYNIYNTKDNTDLLGCRQCVEWHPSSWKMALRMAIHLPNTLPNVEADGIDLSPGSINKVSVTTTLNRYARPPYGTCSNEKIDTLIEDKGNWFRYSPSQCMGEHMQQWMIKECGCLDPVHSLKDEYLKNYTYCNHFNWMTKINAKITGKAKCNNRVLSSVFPYEEIYRDHCKTPCNLYTYKARTSASYGFDPNMIMTMYKEIVKMGIVDNGTHEHFGDIHQLIKRGEINKAVELLRSFEDFTDNFIVVSIEREKRFASVIDQIAALELTNILSLLGGVSSLLIGFNIFAIIEVLEFFIRMILALRRYICMGNMKIRK